MFKQKMGAKSFNQIVGYRNIEELTKKIDGFSYRVLKKECLDLPEKVYSVRYVEMTKEQKAMYESIRKHALVMLEDGEMTTAPAVITQLLRMQQILSGHLKTDDGEMVTFPSLRPNALKDILEEHDGKALIWSRFRHDIKTITDALNKEVWRRIRCCLLRRYIRRCQTINHRELSRSVLEPSVLCRQPCNRRLWSNVDRRQTSWCTMLMTLTSKLGSSLRIEPTGLDKRVT